jgi:NAD(P)-dependent dehydrogenase (short-subunit alcohol dehydrogenase family)
MPLEAIEQTLKINLMAPIYAIHAALPWMLEAGGGKIVNVLSIAAVHTFPGSGAYAASKAGLLALGRSVAADYRSQGVRVTAILPGSVDTPLWEGKSFVPNREDMLTREAVAETIRDVVLMPQDRSVDELLLMPPKGIL